MSEPVVHLHLDRELHNADWTKMTDDRLDRHFPQRPQSPPSPPVSPLRKPGGHWQYGRFESHLYRGYCYPPYDIPLDEVQVYLGNGHWESFDLDPDKRWILDDFMQALPVTEPEMIELIQFADKVDREQRK